MSHEYDLRVSVRLGEVPGNPAESRLELEFTSPAGVWAVGSFSFAGRPVRSTFEQSAGGARDLHLALDFEPDVDNHRQRWAMRLRSVADEPIIEVVEYASAIPSAWEFHFPGTIAHTHKQLSIVSQPVGSASLRLGAFTQHGQLFDLRDWLLVEKQQMCSGMLAIRPGKWRAPGCLAAKGDADGIRISAAPAPAHRSRRSFLLAHVPAAVALKLEVKNIAYLEPKEGYAAWPARQIARHGFARPERQLAYRRQARRTPLSRPTHFCFGDGGDFENALARVRRQLQLAGEQPFWKGDFQAARQWMLDTLRRFHEGLVDGGYLQPLGNPVAARNLGPACARHRRPSLQAP
ncbi:MAG TPA: hypothetical protein VIL86_17960 [Tepidisphaeraceae bacterium]|jgi:hypothetical protein